MAVPKGLWPFWTKYQSSLKLFADAKHASMSVRNQGVGSIRRSSLDCKGHHRTFLDTAAEGAGRVAAADESDSGSGTDDEVYGALAELKARKSRKRSIPGSIGSGSLWARQLIIAGAFRMMHGFRL